MELNMPSLEGLGMGKRLESELWFRESSYRSAAEEKLTPDQKLIRQRGLGQKSEEWLRNRSPELAPGELPPPTGVSPPPKEPDDPLTPEQSKRNDKRTFKRLIMERAYPYLGRALDQAASVYGQSDKYHKIKSRLEDLGRLLQDYFVDEETPTNPL